MKNIIKLSSLAAVFVGLVSIAYAAGGSIALSPTSKTVTVGQIVTATVTVNPGTTAVYTAKMKLSFPAALVQVQSFTFAEGWLSLTQSGYDLVDNTNGVLIKTAGYAGGLTAPKTLGTVTFKVKAAGTANVRVAGDSMLLDASNGNMYSGGSGMTLTSAQATPTPTPTLVARVSATPNPSVSASPEAAEPVPTPVPEEETAVAAVAQAGGGIFGLPTWVAVVILMAIVLIAWFLIRRRKRPNVLG